MGRNTAQKIRNTITNTSKHMHPVVPAPGGLKLLAEFWKRMASESFHETAWLWLDTLFPCRRHAVQDAKPVAAGGTLSKLKTSADGHAMCVVVRSSQNSTQEEKACEWIGRPFLRPVFAHLLQRSWKTLKNCTTIDTPMINIMVHQAQSRRRSIRVHHVRNTQCGPNPKASSRRG